MIEIKSQREIDLIEAAGEVVKAAMAEVIKITKPGIATLELDRKAKETIEGLGGRPAFKGYRGYPGNICTSVNEEVVHGIPGRRILKPGDILGIDIGVEKNGFYADAAVTVEIGGAVPDNAKTLINAAKKALELAVKKAVEGNRLFDISHAIQEYVEGLGYSVVRDFVGHGIGRSMHEDPEIPNFGRPGTGPRLKEGMVFAIEPMVNEGRYCIEILDDGWTAVTKDRKLSAHFEHTVCVTKKGPQLLT